MFKNLVTSVVKKSGVRLDFFTTLKPITIALVLQAQNLWIHQHLFHQHPLLNHPHTLKSSKTLHKLHLKHHPWTLTCFLPKQFCRVIKPADQKWIAQCLYDSTGRLKQQFFKNWFHPPSPSKPTTSPPDPNTYFRQRMFLWGPMRMWGIPLKCTQCDRKMHHSGIYTKVREVIDIDCRYYLIGVDYPRCSKCMIPVCPWSSEILKQLDPSHRNKFPAVLTTHLALDRKCVTLLKPRTAGNSSSFLQQALEEIHSEEWGRRTIDYLTDCELHKKRSALTQTEVIYQQPPPFCPLPLAQWFETVHANEILCHIDELKGVITSTYGSILKLDSTKKVNIYKKRQISCMLCDFSDYNVCVFK